MTTAPEAARPRRAARRIGWAIVWLACALAALFVSVRYREDIARQRERVAHGRLAVTPCGPIEYTSAGDGAPVLVVHGAGGGYDQGLEFALPLAERGFRVVAMSRFGYLRTPLPADASAEAQADAHACLMDVLGIERAAVVGASAGAPSSIQLALRHPRRVAALVLLVPAAYVPRPGGAPSLKTPPATQFLFDTALGSDFLYWIASNLARDTLIESILATPVEDVEGASPAERERIRRVIEDILPVSARRQGLLNDARVTSSLSRYELERIAVPTLALSTVDDRFGTFEAARYTAALIPNARFEAYTSGGHLWVGHHDDVLAAIVDFLGAATRTR